MEIDNPKIVTKNLTVYYDDLCALKDITVNIPSKGITSIIGPSGCGKTTLLKSFNRLIELIEDVKLTGSVFIDGLDIYRDVDDVTELRRRVGLITQTPNPLPMSIYDNVAYGPRIHGLKNRNDLDENVENCLRSANLWNEVKDRLRDPASKLSLGQQQRLNLARTLAVKPEVLLCDEPTSSLDPISAKYVEDQLLALKKDYTILFVTHTLRQAKRISDFVLFLYMGELVEHGTAYKILTNPDDPRTQGYVSGIYG